MHGLEFRMNQVSSYYVFTDGVSDSYLRENDNETDGLNSSAVAENVVGSSIFLHMCMQNMYECSIVGGGGVYMY